ncbi:MAG: hypothetical protein ACRDL4_14355 [Thermoleophilaceae bacterium]
MRRPRILALFVMLLAAGCGGESESSEGTMIDWDLSQSHTVEDVDWPKPDLTAVELSPVSSVSIELPDGKSFESDGDVVHDVTMDRRDRQVRGMQIDSHPRSREAAYELAVRWAGEWKLSQQPFDRWRAGETKTPVISAGREQERIGPKGPFPSVEIRNSFDDERPALVSLSFFWPD